MKKIAVSLLFITGISFLGFSQPSFEWVASAGGSGIDFGYSSDIDANGNIFTTGIFQNTGDFNPGLGINNLTSQGGYDIYIQKLDALGNYVWAESFGSASDDRGHDILVSQSGDIYITGFFQGTIDFNPGGGTNNLTSSGVEDGFLLKLDGNGNFIWVQKIGAGASDKGFSLSEDSQNNIYVAGYLGTDFFVQKFNSAGVTIWNKTITSGLTSNGLKVAIGVDPSDNVYLTGGFQGTMDADPGAGVVNHTSTGAFDIFYLKLDNSGNYVASESFGSTSTDVARNITFDSSGNPIIIGSYSLTVDFDPGAGVENSTSVGITDIFILKLDPSGAFIWNKVIGGSGYDAPISVTVDNNDVYISGEFSETADFDPGLGVYNLTAAGTAGGVDAFVLKLNQNGEFLWAFGFGGVDTDDSGMSINVNSLGDVYLAGLYSGTVDFDPGAGSTSKTSVSNSLDIFQLKLSQCIPTTITPDAATLSNLTGECSVAVPTAPTASNCSGTFNGTSNVTFPITTQGTTVVTWTYDDGNGNTSTQTQNVVIDDITAPVADISTLSDVASECSVTSLTAPTATDNCAGTITGTHNATLPITTQGTTVVTWAYDDGNGNTSTQTQNVVIDDITAPVADVATLTDIAAECEVTSLIAPTATDNCAGSITGTHNASLPITSQGTTTVTWTYDDGNGNTSTQTQDVVIADATAPVADLVTLSDVTSECEVTSLIAPTATDNCAGTVTGTHNVTLPITTTTTIIWTYDDGNGNISTQTQEVIITPIDNSVTVIDDITLSADANGYTYQWVDCNDNNAPIAGETNQTFEATANGSYAVIIDNGDCSVTSACFDITTVGLDNNELIEINVYPNPTSGEVNIESSTKIESIELMNALGQTVGVYSANQETIEIKGERGVYFLKITTEGHKQVLRVVKY